jgi:hypothetical protein
MGKGRSSPSCWPRGALTFRCFTIVECHTAKPISIKRYRGKIEVRQPLFGAAKLKIAGRDQTKLVDGLARQVAVVEATLAGTLRDGDQGCFKGRQQSKSPETQVSVAGHRGGRVEPEDESRSRGALKIA